MSLLEKKPPAFTWRVFLALIFGIVVLQPASLFLWAVAGQFLFSSGITWIVALLWVELSRLYRSPLTKQEMFTIFAFQWFIGAPSLIFFNLIFQSYVRFSDMSLFFGLRDLIPRWYALPYGSEAFIRRTFFHPDWVMPILVAVISLVISNMIGISLGFFTYDIFVRSEKLPFPYQQATAEAIVSMVENREERLKIITATALVGAVYSGLLYLMPLMTSMKVTVLPIPWADLGPAIQLFLPGSSLGFATDLMTFAVGFLVPIRTIVNMLIGCIAVFVVGNSILLSKGVWTTWSYGASPMLIYRESFLHFWMTPVIGFALVSAILPLIRYREILARSFRGVRGRMDWSKIWPLLLFVLSAFANLILIAILVPHLPFLTLAYLGFAAIGLTFLWTMISANSIGLAGPSVNLPYVYQVIMLGSGSRIPDIWFMPMAVSNAGASWCAYFKLADLCETDRMVVVKACLAVLVLGPITAFIYTGMFWSMAEIPSAVYPWLNQMWPVESMLTLWWPSRGMAGIGLDPQLLAGGASIAAVLFLASRLIPIDLVGLTLGISTLPAFAPTMALGALVGRLIRYIVGGKWWDENRTAVVAGFAIGEGVIGALCASIALISKAIWLLPY